MTQTLTDRDPAEYTVLYHGDCIDGFGAAWAAWAKLGTAATYLPVQHGDTPPPVAGRHVVIVDFSYPRERLLALADEAQSLQVVDHHKTAQADLAGLDFCIFDMDKSGAVLSWEYFHPHAPVPPLLLHVQDKDLWQWQLEGSAEITCALRGYDFDFDRWSGWVNGWDTRRGELLQEGGAILRYQAGVVAGAVARATPMVVAGHEVLAANTPVLQSEVAGQLAEGHPFGVAWYQQGERCKFSLRSRDGGIDVSEIAGLFGGGGHPRASGFIVDAPLRRVLEP